MDPNAENTMTPSEDAARLAAIMVDAMIQGSTANVPPYPERGLRSIRLANRANLAYSLWNAQQRIIVRTAQRYCRELTLYTAEYVSAFYRVQ